MVIIRSFWNECECNRRNRVFEIPEEGIENFIPESNSFIVRNNSEDKNILIKIDTQLLYKVTPNTTITVSQEEALIDVTNYQIELEILETEQPARQFDDSFDDSFA